MALEDREAGRHADSETFVAFTIAGQQFGISVMTVRDVLAVRRLNPIPLAPPEIAGSLNLRGRIVTVIDLRLRLGLASCGDQDKGMSIVVAHGPDLYGLMVDTVSEVLDLEKSDFEDNPPTLDPRFRAYATGIYRLSHTLLVVLDVGRLLNHTPLSITGQRYMKPSLDALRPSMEAICGQLQVRIGQ